MFISSPSNQGRPAYTLDPEEESSLLSGLYNGTGKLLTDALWLLDTPRAVIGSVIDSAMEGFDPDEFNNPFGPNRIDTEDLLEKAGMEEGIGRTALGLVGDIATDPLTWATAGGNALTKSGKAARAIGLLDDAPRLASKKLKEKAIAKARNPLVSQAASITNPDDAIKAADDFAEIIGDETFDLAGVASDMGVSSGRAERTLRDLGLESIDQYGDEAIRPLVGTRESRRALSLDDLIQASNDPAAAMQKLEDYALKNDMLASDLLQEKALGSSFGAGIPLLDNTTVAGDLLGESVGRGMAAAGDRVSEALRYGAIPGTSFSPGKAAFGFFDRMMGGQTGALEQGTAGRIMQAADEGEGAARELVTEIGMQFEELERTLPESVKRQFGVETLWSEEVGQKIDRVIEGRAATQADKDFIQAAGLQPIINKYGDVTADILRRSKDAGINSQAVSTGYTKQYRPYQIVSDFKNKRPGSGGDPQTLFDTTTGDQLARQEALQLPGGIDQARYLQKNWRDVARKAGYSNPDELDQNTLADILYQDINSPNSDYYKAVAGSDVALEVAGGNLREYSRGKARALSEYLRRFGPDETGLQNHPLDALATYATGRERAMGTGKELQNVLADLARPGAAESVSGGGAVNLRKALSQAGLRSQFDEVLKRSVDPNAVKDAEKNFKTALNALGKNTDDAQRASLTRNVQKAQAQIDAARKDVSAARDGAQGYGIYKIGKDPQAGAAKNVQEIIAKSIEAKTGRKVDASAIDLDQFHIPQERLNTLKKMHDFYVKPQQAQNTIFEMVNSLGRLFKSQVLLWPSRYSRDLMSGGLTNIVEAGGGNPTQLAESYRAAERLMSGDIDSFAQMIEDIPAYASFTNPKDRVNAFVKDATRNKLFGGLRSADFIDDPAGESLRNFIPGAGDQTLMGGIKGVGRNLGPKQFFDSNSALYKDAQKIANWTDTINRTSGYINLMRTQGTSAEEAARRMLAAHVDYDSLSKGEKQLRKLIPFYSYSSRILKYAVENLLTKPGGGYSQGLRTVERMQRSDEDTFVPEYIRSGTGLNINPLVDGLSAATGTDVKGLMGYNPEDDVYISQFDYPGAQALSMFDYKKAPGSILPDLTRSVGGTLENIASNANPLAQGTLELLSGEDSFRKEPLGQVYSNYDRILRGGGQWMGFDMDEYGPLYGNNQALNSGWTMLKQAADMLVPGTSRIFNISAKGATALGSDNPVGALGSTLINAVAPVRLAGVTPTARDKAMLTEIEEAVRSLPNAYTKTSSFLNRDQISQLAPEMQAALAVQKSLLRKQMENRKK